MNNLETRRNKINSCMAELFNLYMEDRKSIKGSISLDGVKCTLNFGETSKKKITDKKVMAIDCLRGPIAIRCKTKDESDKFLKLVDKLGIKWGEIPAGSEFALKQWNLYGDKTCYEYDYFGSISYCDMSYFEEKHYTIKSPKWFFDNFKPKE